MLKPITTATFISAAVLLSPTAEAGSMSFSSPEAHVTVDALLGQYPSLCETGVAFDKVVVSDSESGVVHIELFNGDAKVCSFYGPSADFAARLVINGAQPD